MAFLVPERVATSIAYVYNSIDVLLVSLNIVYMRVLSASVKDDPFALRLRMLEDWRQASPTLPNTHASRESLWEK